MAAALLLVYVLAADDLVDDPVENVKNEEDEGEGHAGHGVDALGPADEEFLHLLDALLGRGGRRGGRVVVVAALDGHAVFGLQAGGAHAVTGETEAPLARLILLENRERERQVYFEVRFFKSKPRR